MAYSAFLNVSIALLWMALNNAWSLSQCVIGLFLGFVLLWVGGPLFHTEIYCRRISFAVVFSCRFVYTFLMANFAMARAVLTMPVSAMTPILMAYDTTDLAPFEVAFLAQCITLTPGTTAVDISPDRSHLVIHVFDGSQPDAVRHAIDASLKIPMLRFTR